MLVVINALVMIRFAVNLGNILAPKSVAFPRMSHVAFLAWKNGANSTTSVLLTSQTVGAVACLVIKNALKRAFPMGTYAAIPASNTLVGINV
jgi:hypothetical protein